MGKSKILTMKEIDNDVRAFQSDLVDYELTLRGEQIDKYIQDKTSSLRINRTDRENLLLNISGEVDAACRPYVLKGGGVNLFPAVVVVQRVNEMMVEITRKQGRHG